MYNEAFKVYGTKSSLQDLRNALLAESAATQLLVTEPSEEPETGNLGSVRVRQPGLQEVGYVILIHVTAGIAADALYDWLRAWLRGRASAAQLRVHEASPAPLSHSKE